MVVGDIIAMIASDSGRSRLSVSRGDLEASLGVSAMAKPIVWKRPKNREAIHEDLVPNMVLR